MNQGNLPPTPIMMLQVGLALVVFCCSYIFSTKSILTTLIVVFVSQLIMAFSIRFFYIDYYHNPLGFNPQDAVNYDHIAAMGYRYSFGDYNQLLDTYNLMLDDKGMFFITFMVYKLAGTPLRGIQLLVIFNALAVMLSSYGAYKLSRLFFDVKVSSFVAFFWGTELYAAYTAAAGLKENFMVVLLLWGMYYLVTLYRNLSVRNLIAACVLASTALLFRMALFYMFLAILMFVLSLKSGFFRKYILFFIVVIIAVSAYKSYETINELAEMRGYSYEMLETIAEGKISRTWPMSEIVSYLSALFGPFPNVVATGEKASYITLYSFSSTCKVFFSFFFVYGSYLMFREKKVELMPLFIFWVLNTIMLIFTVFTLHDRYQWPHMPLMLVISAYGAIEWYGRKHKIKWDYLYFIFAVAMIVIFNFR